MNIRGSEAGTRITGTFVLPFLRPDSGKTCVDDAATVGCVDALELSFLLIRRRRKWQFMLLAYPCPFRGCSSLGSLRVSCRRACGVAGADRVSLSESNDYVEHRQVRDQCGERIRQRVARQETIVDRTFRTHVLEIVI